MSRLHVHIKVDDLKTGIAFYRELFGAEPDVLETDYAKWQLADPAVNFALSLAGGARLGVDHLGIEAEDGAVLSALSKRLEAAGALGVQQKAANCCYAVSDKSWGHDPSGVKWELFHTTGRAQDYGADRAPPAVCCRPEAQPAAPAAAACCGV